MFYNYNLNGIVIKTKRSKNNYRIAIELSPILTRKQCFHREMENNFNVHYLHTIFYISFKLLWCLTQCGIIVFSGRHRKIQFASSGWLFFKIPSLFDTKPYNGGKIKLWLALHSISSHLNPFLFTKYYFIQPSVYFNL
jgi:hypothetical protein